MDGLRKNLAVAVALKTPAGAEHSSPTVSRYRFVIVLAVLCAFRYIYLTLLLPTKRPDLGEGP